MSFESWSHFWIALLYSSDWFFFNSIVIVVSLWVVSLLICIYIAVVFVVSRLTRISQEKLGVLNLFLHLEAPDFADILKQPKFTHLVDSAVVSGFRELGMPSSSDMDLLQDIPVTPENQDDQNRSVSSGNHLTRNLAICLVLILMLVALVAVFVVYEPHDSLNETLAAYSNFHSNFRLLFCNFFTSFRSILGYSLTGNFLFYENYRMGVNGDELFMHLNEIAKLVPFENVKLLNTFEAERSVLLHLNSIVAFIASHRFEIPPSLVVEFKKLDFVYNFTREVNFEILKIQYPEIQENWYSHPDLDLFLSGDNQQSLINHLMTSDYLEDIITSTSYPLFNLGLNSHNHFYDQIMSQRSIYTYFAIGFISIGLLSILLVLFFFWNLRKILHSKIKFLFGFVLLIFCVFLANSVFGFQDFYQESVSSSEVVDLYANYSKDALFLESTFCETEFYFARYLLSTKEQFLSSYVTSLSKILDILSDSLKSVHDFEPSFDGYIQEFLNIQRAAVFMTANSVQSPLVNHHVFSNLTLPDHELFKNLNISSLNETIDEDTRTALVTSAFSRSFRETFDLFFKHLIRPLSISILETPSSKLEPFGSIISDGAFELLRVLIVVFLICAFLFGYAVSFSTKEDLRVKLTHVKQETKIGIISSLLKKSFVSITALAFVLSVLSFASWFHLNQVQQLPHSISLAAERISLTTKIVDGCVTATLNPLRRLVCAANARQDIDRLISVHQSLLFDLNDYEPAAGRFADQDELNFANDFPYK
ncbi:hypothetical protein GEMRC1_011545 [Eukaryota sp. GEM-RC1]